MRQPLSVAIITLNAAAQLEACLQSARFADEIVVVDSGSSDGTQTLAERHGAYPEVVEACYRALIAGFIAREQTDFTQMSDVETGDPT